MKATITLEHWNIAKEADKAHGGNGRTQYCPIAQCLIGMGLPNVAVVPHGIGDYYVAYYGSKLPRKGVKVIGCGAELAYTFDTEKPLRDGLLPCDIELPDEVSAS